MLNRGGMSESTFWARHSEAGEGGPRKFEATAAHFHHFLPLNRKGLARVESLN